MLDKNHSTEPSQCHNHATTGLARIITVWYIATEMLDCLAYILMQIYQISDFPQNSNLFFFTKQKSVPCGRFLFLIDGFEQSRGQPLPAGRTRACYDMGEIKQGGRPMEIKTSSWITARDTGDVCLAFRRRFAAEKAIEKSRIANHRPGGAACGRSEAERIRQGLGPG